ncbi:RNase adapter RapZ [Rhabdothermincola salaria]|uniref:RNase adapter RapZ n=1 Tax=Rhabdothermincola salaria TaxID=2903142 RepID=UPI001E4F63C1|nr:RNase adapter RapZ [Rhabdothermincola salaria]MCD9622595.1 RNase adapter RapZ [Rhabdothermincola salaria]
MSDFVVITGLSGAGRSEAANILEDLGWFVIDNLPPALMTKVAELAHAPGAGIAKVVLVVGTGPYHNEVLPALEALRRQGGRVRIAYFEAGTDVLVRRYESSRRRHPLAAPDLTLADTIEAERELLGPVKAEADVVVDTSELNVHELRTRVQDLFAEDTPASGMQTTLISFGYKHGLPLDTDLVIDCRFLPNPHWVEELRPQTGLDQPVKDYVLGQDITAEFLDEMRSLLELLLPAYVKEGKSYLTIAFGCTGGRHRSVAIAEEIAAGLRADGFDLRVTHRDLGR